MRAPEESVLIEITISRGNTDLPETGRRWSAYLAANRPRANRVVVVVVKVLALSMGTI